MGLVTIANNKKEDGFSIYNAHHRYIFLIDKTQSNNSFGMMNLLIYTSQKKDYNYKKANHGAKMILKKKFKKTDYSLVVKINQTQVYHFCKKKDYKNIITDDITKRFQKQILELYLEFISRNT